MRTCRKCGLDKLITEFKTYRCNSKTSYRYVCLDCWRPSALTEYHNNKDNKMRKTNRKIRTNARSSYLKHTLDAVFVAKILKLPCSYCGIEQKDLTAGRIGLDRKDSTVGYVQSNVVQACSRCNFLKRDMPYAAWEILIPAVRSARERGLFGDWIGGWIQGNKKHK